MRFSQEESNAFRHGRMSSEQNSIPYSGVGVGTIKKSATGRGNAGKPEMIAAMRRLGHLPDDDNEADALALLYFSMHSTDTKGMHDAA